MKNQNIRLNQMINEFTKIVLTDTQRNVNDLFRYYYSGLSEFDRDIVSNHLIHVLKTAECAKDAPDDIKRDILKSINRP